LIAGIDSAQKLYIKLKQADDILRFDKIAVLALQSDGELNDAVVKDLIKLFRYVQSGQAGALPGNRPLTFFYDRSFTHPGLLAMANSVCSTL